MDFLSPCKLSATLCVASTSFGSIFLSTVLKDEQKTQLTHTKCMIFETNKMCMVYLQNVCNITKDLRQLHIFINIVNKQDNLT